MTHFYEDKIIENNKLIATFVGLILTWVSTNSYFEPNDCDLDIVCPDGFDHDTQLMYLYDEEQPDHCYKFNTEWNWLMVAVDKIESLGYTFDISTTGATFFDKKDIGSCNGYFSKGDGTKINAAYSAVVAFIKWYNKKFSLPK